MKKTMMWKSLACNFTELNLDITLGGGQSFRWSKTANEEWLGVISGHVCSLKQDAIGNLLYFFHKSNENLSRNEDGSLPPKRQKKISKQKQVQNVECVSNLYYESILTEYLNLEFPLGQHYASWSSLDENFKKVGKDYKGIRILRQDPIENLFSFICSANNNIPRITSMVEKLCLNYGEKLCEVNDHTFHAFPSVDRLAKDDVEQELRNLGFGYRAKYINQTAKILHKEKPHDWLSSLRKATYSEAHNALISLPGVGAKVADCVCLMSLDKYNAIPVDTHIWKVTVNDYFPNLKSNKALTDKIYKQIGDFYRERFGDYAGWANTVLFAADLKMFKINKK